MKGKGLLAKEARPVSLLRTFSRASKIVQQMCCMHTYGTVHKIAFLSVQYPKLNVVDRWRHCAE